MSRLLLIALPLLVPLAALAAEPVAYVNAARPLLDKVRSATARYRGLNATLADGFVRPLVVAGQVALVGQLLLKARTRFAWQAVRVA